MPATTTTNPSVPLPEGAAFGDNWQPLRGKDQVQDRTSNASHRVVCGVTRGIEGNNSVVWSYAIQLAEAHLMTASWSKLLECRPI